jgi:AcrR family transcriptional regulator
MPARKTRRDKAVDALMALAAEAPWGGITLSQVAGRAGLSLADLRAEFRSLEAVFAAFLDRIDQAMLSDLAPPAPDETVRDRIFDVVMKRFDALAPYKAAMRSLARGLGREPGLALWTLVRLTRTQRWVLEAAGGSARGLKGRAHARGLALVYGRVFAVWLEEDDPGLPRTMAALDRGLRRGESWARACEGPLDFADGLARLGANLAAARRRARPAGTAQPAGNGADR